MYADLKSVVIMKEQDRKVKIYVPGENQPEACNGAISPWHS